MRDKIQAILEREIAKLDAMSSASPTPLPSSDIRALEILIKAHHSFVTPTPPPDSSPDDPTDMTTEALLMDLTSVQTKPV